MINSYKLQTLDLSEDISNLLCEIDKKIMSISKKKLNSIRYGFNYTYNKKDVKRLIRYQEIIINKNCDCYNGYRIDDLISRVKQLLNRN